MVDLLELPAIRRIIAPMSVELYHQLAELGPDVQPVELIRSLVIEKADKTSRSQLHIYLVRALWELCRAAAQSQDLLVLKEDPLTFGDSEPEPDVAVVAGPARNYRHLRVTTALLVIEVAVTSLALDREKATLYAEGGIPEYWIVLAQRGEIEAYTVLEDGRYTQRRTYRQGETLLSTALPALQVDLATLFAG